MKPKPNKHGKPMNVPRRNDRAYDVLKRLADKMGTDFDTLLNTLEQLTEGYETNPKEEKGIQDLVDKMQQPNRKKQKPNIEGKTDYQIAHPDDVHHWRKGFEDFPDLDQEEIREIVAARKSRAIKKYWIRTKESGMNLMRAQRFVEAYDRNRIPT